MDFHYIVTGEVKATLQFAVVSSVVSRTFILALVFAYGEVTRSFS